MKWSGYWLALGVWLFGWQVVCGQELKTWDGKHSIQRIDVRMVYFLPHDRRPLPDWQARLEYFADRIERFHQREFNGQSVLKVTIEKAPFDSEFTTGQLRAGDANFIFFRTLREVDERLQFGRGERAGFPILLVMSDINWKPLDDFYRVKPVDRSFKFEGQLIEGRHHPGAEAGGARATYLAQEAKGWGLVSADGWRVPYVGSDCVVYHEGVGHTIGLPHPEPGNSSVMSLGQYHDWISRSNVDESQKKRLGWQPPATRSDLGKDLYSTFRALPEPRLPKPHEDVVLKLDWPTNTALRSGRVLLQTSLWGLWTQVATFEAGAAPQQIRLGNFDRPGPVAYRVEATSSSGESVAIWGYLQVRAKPDVVPFPDHFSEDFETRHQSASPVTEVTTKSPEIDLLKLVDPQKHAVNGQWKLVDGRLESPKQYGARLQLPYQPPEEYQLNVIAEPLDAPHGLILGQRSGDRRFLALVNYRTDRVLSALENIDKQNVGNSTTLEGDLLKQNQLSQILVTVRKESVQVVVDGREIIHWKGARQRLSLGDYWSTPQAEALFVGAYDCRYRFHRITLRPISGEGKKLERP